MNSIPRFDQNEQLQSSVDRFFARFKLGALLRQCNIHKMAGVSCLQVIRFIFILVFGHKNLYEALRSSRLSSGQPAKDVFYRFLNEGRFNWRRLLLLLSLRIAKLINPLTSSLRERVFIIDDSFYSRNRSKAVELLARVRDHVANCYVRGFRMLTLGWSDGNTFLPVAFSLLSSTNPAHRLQETAPNLNRRTLAYRRRQESIQSTPDVLISLLEQALAAGHRARYVLFDSWFAFPKTICRVQQLGLHVICMLKAMPKVFYTYQGKRYTLSRLFGAVPKRRGRSKILASLIVTIDNSITGTPLPVKIVFVRDRHHRRKWLALLSTDVELDDAEIIRIYGKRWDIEVFFKMAKSYLRLAKEFQGRSYDMMTAHTTIVCMRYLMLAVASREQADVRTVGGMFYACCDELEDLSFAEALLLILDLLKQALEKTEVLSEALFQEIVNNFIASLPPFLRRSLAILGCES